MPHTPSPRPHLLRYVASRGNPMLCIQRAYGSDHQRIDGGRAATGGAYLSFHSDRTVCARRCGNAVSHVTRQSKHLTRTYAVAAVFAALSCEPVVNLVRVEPGTTPTNPVFVLSDTTGHGSSGTIYGLSVIPCGADSAVWQIAANGSNGAPARLEYGVTPAGYFSRVGPEPLRKGCYDIFVTDGRRARFRIDAFGHLVPEPRRDSQPRARTDTSRRR